ncbi:MAG TPA: phosphatase PAP2 family protein [Solirubrobacteraceae bacterium]|nr:phosphatase PAP2 family protein [Solirubrobacteraceae bacterium]
MRRPAALFTLVAVLAAAIHVVAPLDLAAVRDAHRLAVEPFAGAARELTALGGTDAILGLTAASTAVLVLRRRRREALALVGAVAATEAAVAVVKHVVVRPRPPAADALVHAAGYSFPSGHAAASLALFAGLALVAARGRSAPARTAIVAAAAVLVLAIGLTRVYLGAHYPTDVVAGWLLAAALATAGQAAAASVRRATTSPDS